MSADREPPQLPAWTEPTLADDEEDDGIDLQMIKDIAGFVLGAPGRHKLLALLTLAVGLGATWLVLWALPRTYHVESTLLAQRNQVIGALAVPERLMPEGADSPTRYASQTVLSRDNLMALIEKTGLTKKWDASRAPAAKLKDWLMAKLGRKPTEADKFEALVAMLESRISVDLGTEWTGDGTMTFAVDWPDPGMAFELATAAQQNFLEARHVSEIDNISEAISILQSRADTMRDEIDKTALQIEGMQTRAPVPAPSGDPTAAAPVRRRPPAGPHDAGEVSAGPSEGARSEAAALKATWDGKRSAIRDLEDIRRRRLLELQSHLTELRAVYSDSHPLVADAQRSINMLSQESPQVGTLRREEAELRAEYRSLTGVEPDAPSAGLSQLLQPAGARVGPSGARRSVAVAAEPAEGDDRAMEFLKAQLRQQMQAYDRLIERIDAVRMELDTAEVAFKYRYTVTRPAQMPRAPSKPNVTLIRLGGVVASLLLALIAALVADLRKGNILQSWQVERMLDIPVLGEMNVKS